MVYKVCKGGVRSGNTLRGLQTLRTRRYASQACVIGRSNLSRKQVDKLLEDSVEDAAISNALRNTDVVLSLNKQERWRLPATVTHMIRAGKFSHSKAAVSVLERHKLKRRANCVGFACSQQTYGDGVGDQGSVQNTLGQNGVQQGEKKYFSFNLDYLGEEESRRQRKKRIAEEMKELSREKRSKAKKDGQKSMRTVNVFTIEGRENRLPLPNTKPVYRMEVFYPCPKSCSLTFNPKYTDVIMTQGDDGKMEVRSNIKNEKKSHKKKRKRFTAHDLATFETDSKRYDEDVEEMWQEVYEDERLSKNESVTIAKEQESTASLMCPEKNLKEETDMLHKDLLLSKHNSESESILALLVNQAELARASWNHSTLRSRQKQNSPRNIDNPSSAIKCLHNKVVLKTELADTERKTKHTTTFQSSNSNNSASAQASSEPEQDLTLPSVPVILSSAEVSQENLKSTYGNRYTEADCQPRRFCINITDNVTTLLSVSPSFRSPAYTTFIVFSSKGFNEEGLEVFEAAINCAACSVAQHITYSMPYHKSTSLETVINTFVGNLLDLKEAGNVNFSKEAPSYNSNAFEPVQEMMMEKMKIKVATFFTLDELQRTSETGSLQEERDEHNAFPQSLLEFESDGETGLFCEICYASINPTESEALPGTQLNACGHLFCDSCWRTHLRTRLQEGSFRMTCPGYQCDTPLGPSTLLSLLHVTEVAQILRRACENEVETSHTAKWCPSPTCGRVIKLSPKSSRSALASLETNLKADAATNALCVDVTCACGESWCFNCLSPAHWPARCEQVQDYMEKLSALESKKNHDKSKQASVSRKQHRLKEPEFLDQIEGKLCPRCSRFIDKNGGCPHISCKCGHEFCWTCLKPYTDHTDCSTKAKTLHALTLRVNIKHIKKQAPDLEEEDRGSQRKTDHAKSHRHRASMYKRALKQHEEAGLDRESRCYKSDEELTIKICKAAGKDLQFKKEVLLLCNMPGSERPTLSEDMNMTEQDLAQTPIVHHVLRFLKSCRKARLALRHVAEFTYVLLQDCPASTDKRRAFRVASDLIGYCSFSLSILQAGGNQDPRAALRRLSDIQTWSSRALDALLTTVQRLRQ